MSTKPRIPEIDSALHIIKGAIVKVFKTPLTNSVQAHKKGEGRISIHFERADPPTKEELKKVEDLSLEVIQKGLKIQQLKMTKTEAEQKFCKKVNDTFIYDKFPVPDSVKDVTVILIDGWNVNCCAGNHVDNTSLVRPIKIQRCNHRPQKKEVEFVFGFSDGSSPAAAGDKKKGGKQEAKTSATPAATAPNVTDVRVVANYLGTLLQEEMKFTPEQVAKLKEPHLQQALIAELTTLKNASYAKGFEAGSNLPK